MFLKLKYMFYSDERVYEDFLALFLLHLTTGIGREDLDKMTKYISSNRPLVAKRVYKLIKRSKWQTK